MANASEACTDPAWIGSKNHKLFETDSRECSTPDKIAMFSSTGLRVVSRRNIIFHGWGRMSCCTLTTRRARQSRSAQRTMVNSNVFYLSNAQHDSSGWSSSSNSGQSESKGARETRQRSASARGLTEPGERGDYDPGPTSNLLPA